MTLFCLQVYGISLLYFHYCNIQGFQRILLHGYFSFIASISKFFTRAVFRVPLSPPCKQSTQQRTRTNVGYQTTYNIFYNSIKSNLINFMHYNICSLYLQSISVYVGEIPSSQISLMKIFRHKKVCTHRLLLTDSLTYTHEKFLLLKLFIDQMSITTDILRWAFYLCQWFFPSLKLSVD